MNQPDASNALKGLIEGIPGKTLAAKLRFLMPEIDRRVREGVQHEEIVETLNTHGFDVNLNTFRSYLYRYRKQLRAGEGNPKPTKSTTTANGNSPVEVAGEDNELPDDVSPSLADALDARKRDQLGDKYLSRQRPIFNKRSDKK